MSLRTFLTIVALLGIIHGAAFIVAPDQVAMLYGLPTSAAVVLVSRFFGGALLGWCGIIWSARSFRDDAAIRSVLLATGVAEAIGILIAAAGALSGTMNALGWLAVAIYAFGTVGCAYFAMGQKKLAAV
jgi:hypothetical protein